MKKKIVMIMGFVIALVFVMQANAMATTYSNTDQVPLSVYRDDNLDIDPVNENVIPRTWSSASTSLEERYISPYITTVKNQNPYGTCWAFSYIAASEASMVREGLAISEGEGISEINLSELHLAYFLSHSVVDSLGGTIGDEFSVTDTSTNAFLNTGGNQNLATYRVANWYGLVDEETAPYTSITSTEDVVLSDGVAYAEDVVHLENAYWISMQDKDTVKKLIKEYGACATSYCSEDIYYNTGNASSWNQSSEVAVFCPNNVETNHGITIVGWDDTYSVDNFTGSYKPTSNGAWYCKNSWGSTWSKDGYFWISYEDVPLLNGEAFFYDYGAADNYDKNYQYDGGAVSAYYQCNYAANIYEAQESEYIKAVGFYTYDSNYDCTIKVYKNCALEDPTSGNLLTSINANQLYAGFHTVELDKGYLLNKGETFSVVIYMNATDGEDTYVSVDSNYSDSGSWCKNTSLANEGESFVGDTWEQWQDVSQDGYNCRIKAYTDRKIFIEEISLDQSEVTLDVGENASLSVALVPENASDKSVTWRSDNSAIATVDENGYITAVGKGTTRITCTTADGSELKAQCDVTVQQPVTSVVLNYKSCEILKGGALQLQASVFPDDANNKSIQWSSADETVAVVSDAGIVTGMGYGTTTISCIATDRNVCVTTCLVTVMEKIISISLDCTSTALEKGQSLQLSATLTPKIEKTKGVYWISSDSDVAVVDANGLVTAIATGGPITIQCIAKDGSGLKASCEITVKENEQISTESTEVVPTIDETVEDENLITVKKQYRVNADGTAQFVDGSECSSVVNIPDMIIIDGKEYKVTAILADAFLNNKDITTVEVGNNVIDIEKMHLRVAATLLV